MLPSNEEVPNWVSGNLHFLISNRIASLLVRWKIRVSFIWLADRNYKHEPGRVFQEEWCIPCCRWDTCQSEWHFIKAVSKLVDSLRARFNSKMTCPCSIRTDSFPTIISGKGKGKICVYVNPSSAVTGRLC